MRRVCLFLLLVAISARAQWTALGDMPRPSRQGNALRFENAQAVVVVTALSPEVIRVRIGGGRDHSYAVVNRNLGDPAATFSIEQQARSTIFLVRTAAKSVSGQWHRRPSIGPQKMA
jgi:hypothetical protein